MPADGAGALPNVVIIGAMKSGTTALHRYLDRHPDIAMSEPKELNFFFGPADPPDSGDDWHLGNWHRGLDWYAGHFPATAAVRGESSPGYTSPSHPEAAERMATTIPGARLIYIVRDPVARAVSQYRHHHRQGTETRTIDDAVPDPGSHYIARGRYYERLAPFLRHFAPSQVTVVAHEELLVQRRATLRGLFAFVGVDPYWDGELERLWHTAPGDGPTLSPSAHAALVAAVADDVHQLRDFAGREFAGWCV